MKCNQKVTWQAGRFLAVLYCVLICDYTVNTCKAEMLQDPNKSVSQLVVQYFPLSDFIVFSIMDGEGRLLLNIIMIYPHRPAEKMLSYFPLWP